jgi:hypothetical protein
MAFSPGPLNPSGDQITDPETASRILPWSDPATAALILTNLAVMGIAVYQGWDMGIILWIYWSQSVIIGFFQFVKILGLKHFTTEGMTSNGVPVEPTKKAKRSLAGFFVLHYGFFHFAYFLFLAMEVPLSPSTLTLVLYGALVFFINHAFSCALNYRWDTEREQHLGRVILIPYARIIPMHLATVFSFIFLGGLGIIAFMLLKTIADTLTHIAEHA